MDTDAELVSQALDGCREAFGRLSMRWAPRVLALSRARTRSQDAAEDLTQESLLRAFVALPSLKEREKFGSWLLGIATRCSLDWLKRKRRAEVRFSELGGRGPVEEGGPPAPGAEWEVDRADEVEWLLAEVESLPSVLRTVLYLYYYDDMSYKELAGVLGVSPATVNARLTQARSLLRQRTQSSRR